MSDEHYVDDDRLDARLRAGLGALVAEAPGPPPLPAPTAGRPATRRLLLVAAAVVLLVVGVAAIVKTTQDDGQLVRGGPPSTGQPAPAPLGDTDWVLVRATDAGVSIEGDQTVTLSFSACTGAGCPFGRHRVGASDGCNSIGGDVDVTERELKLRGFVSTLVGCSDDLASAVSRVLLSGGSLSYEVDGNTLRLVDGSVVLEYQRGAAQLPEVEGDIVVERRHEGDLWRLTSEAADTMVNLRLMVRDQASMAVDGGGVGTSDGSTDTSDSQQIVPLGAGQIIYGIAPTRVTRVTAQVDGQEPVELDLFPMESTLLKAFGAYTARGSATIRMYDASGNVTQEQVNHPSN